MSSDQLVEPFGAAVANLASDPRDLAASLHDATRQRAVEAFGSRKSDFEALELETMLWDLVVRLNSVGYITSGVKANAGPEVRTIVTSWIQANMNQPTEPSNLQSLKWMYTRNQAAKHKVGNNDIVTELDLDAPLRQGRAIAEEDRVGDDVFYKYIFELLLAGQYDTARTICADTNNWLMRATLGAIQSQGRDENSHSLVVEACRELSNTSSTSLNRYEAGVYGLLCKNLEAAAPFCESWESLLLAHLLCGASLEAFERRVSQDHKIALQGQDWRRQIILALIQGRFMALVHQLLSEVTDPTSAADSVLVNTVWLMRVLLHIQIASGQQADDRLVQIYIEYLCQDPALLASRLDLVPVYAELLTGESQTHVYGHVLAQITDPDVQAKQIELARNYNIDLVPAIEYALELNFVLYSTETIHASSVEVSNADSRLVGVLQWPVTAELWPNAARALVRAYSLLLTDFSHRSGVVLLTSKISAEYVRNRAMDAIRVQIHEHPDVVADLSQLQQYTHLGNALAALDAWHMRDQHVPGWRSTAPKLIGQVIDAVNQALQFAAPSPGLSIADSMAEIRRTYIPRIVFELLGVLRDAESVNAGYAHVALEFAVKIADENLKLYELFDESLLQSLAEPALAVGI